MKRNKTLVVAVSSALLFNFFAGCKSEGTGRLKNANVDVWSTSCLDKIMRDDVYQDRGEKAININLAKNETEGAQLIITNNAVIDLVNQGSSLDEAMKKGKVDSLTVDVSEIKDGKGNVIPKENFKVYFQKYVYCPNDLMGNKKVHVGYIPDMILPYEYAVEFDENVVESINQGLYFTVETTRETAAGVYTGTCILNADGTIINVPININVWDIELSEQVHTESAFLIWGGDLMYGEMSSTQETFDAYYEVCAEYKCSPTSFFINDYTLEQYVDKVMEIGKDGRISSFTLPARTSAKGQTMDYDFIRNAIKEIVKRSGDASVIAKANYYFGSYIDEPQFDNTGNRFRLAKKIAREIDATEEAAIQELEEEGFFAGKTEEESNSIKEEIRKIPNLLTTSYDDTVYAKDNYGVEFEFGEMTYCPLWEVVSGDNYNYGKSNIELMQDLKEANGNVWWYTCLGPSGTRPSYNLDSDLVGARVVNSMMYDYGIDGNLYWAVNYSKTTDGGYGDLTRPADSYNGDTTRGASASYPVTGEGYFLYPGVKYGSEKPFGTLRFEAIRDGVEDYEYYYYLDGLLADLSAYYDIELSGREMLANIFSTMFNGNNFNPSAANFEKQKKAIVDVILGCKEESRFILQSVVRQGAQATVNFLVASDYAVEVNGEKLTGEAQGLGKKYAYSINMEKEANEFVIQLTKGNEVKTIIESVGGKVTEISCFEDASATQVFTANSDAITFSLNTDTRYASGVGSLKTEIVSTFNPSNPSATLGDTHQVRFNVKTSTIDMTKLDSISFSVYNGTVDAEGNGVKTTMKIGFYASGLSKTVETKVLNPGWNYITLKGIQQLEFSRLHSTERIYFEFYNTVDNKDKEAMPKQIYFFDNFIYQNVLADEVKR